MYVGPPGNASVVEGHYQYMEDLRQLVRRAPVWRGSQRQNWGGVSTPLVHEAWVRELRNHPDQEYATYLLDGNKNGFRVGYQSPLSGLVSAKKNMGSVQECPQVVDDYIQKECQRGSVLGPLSGVPEAEVHISRFGIIPKSGQPGKWRLILDLSYPESRSVNDGISRDLCSLSYASVDDAIKAILSLGQGTQLAKLDLESAYRMIPIHPGDRWMFGMRWKGKLYMDKALPFGLRSAPKIFTAVADGLMWVMCEHGVQWGLHYLDDYMFFGPKSSNECEEALRQALRVCAELGVRVSQHKVEGPSSAIIFWGILLDTEKLEARLPEAKLRRLLTLLRAWQGRRRCKKRELLSLIGHLQHASKVIPAGRSFLRRMIDTSTLVKKLHHHIRLNKGFRSDLQWWLQYLEIWNGCRMHDVYQVHEAIGSGDFGCIRIMGLWSSVQFYFSKGIASSTSATYKAGQNRYLKFCVAISVSPLPLRIFVVMCLI